MFKRIRELFRRPLGSSVRENMMFVGRARLITHLFDEWGEEASSEFGFDSKPAGFEPLLVFEFAPWRERTWWTYCTAGLSLCPAMDRHPPTELIAYSETQSRGLVDLLYQLAFKDDTALYYRAGDITSFGDDPPDLGIPLGRDFGFLEPPEKPELMTFPDVTIRSEDQRYMMARPGEDRTRVQFLRVIALANAESSRWAAMREAFEKTHAWRCF